MQMKIDLVSSKISLLVHIETSLGSLHLANFLDVGIQNTLLTLPPEALLRMVTSGAGVRGATLHVRRTLHGVTLHKVTHPSVSEDQTKKRSSPKIKRVFATYVDGDPLN